MVRAVRASQRHQVRSSGVDEGSIHDDRGRNVIKKVNGQRVIKQFGSSEKRKRFNAEDRSFIAAIRNPKASTIRADGQPGGEDRAAPSPGAPAPGDLL
jgi:hypothetical protein